MGSRVLKDECDCALFGAVRYYRVRTRNEALIDLSFKLPFTKSRWLYVTDCGPAEEA